MTAIWTDDNLLNPAAFTSELRIAMRNFDSVLEATSKTGSSKVESTHFLIALSQIAGCKILERLEEVGLSQAGWLSGLERSAVASDSPPPGHLRSECFTPGALEMLEKASAEEELIGEVRLLIEALRHATDSVKDLCSLANVPLENWMSTFEDELVEIDALEPFSEDGEISEGVFSGGGLYLVKWAFAEAVAMGAKSADVRHLLLAFAESQQSALHYPLHLHDLKPLKLSEMLRLSLGVPSPRDRPAARYSRDSCHPALQLLLEDAGALAARAKCGVIGEIHLAQALVSGKNSAARILENEGIQLDGLAAILARSEYEEVDIHEASTVADIDTVRERLRARLVGQDTVITRILPYIQRMRFGFVVPDRPVGVFLFCGQSGCGKTEMAKELARAVFGSEDELIFLEMGQFQKSESMNIFVGAPPGYVGYGEGKLTNGLRDKPKAVILFDEIEKATATVFDALLRFLDEGKIDDPAGLVRDGSGCIVVMTSNVAAKQLGKLANSFKSNPAGRTVIREKMREALEAEELRPEFLNRVDEILLFQTLTEENYKEIADRMLVDYLGRLKSEHGIEVEVDDYLPELIGRYCASVEEGARLVRRLIQSTVITPVIDFALSHDCPIPVKLHVTGRLVPGDENGEPIGEVNLEN